ncbi:MAG: glycosyltransferase [Gemmatimonadales bacterium]
MSLNRTPDLSVILPTADNYATIRRTVSALRAQTVLDRIELVIVAPTDDPQIVPEEVAGFMSVKVVNGGPLKTSNISRAAGIRVATAPIVVLAEDHCFPEPEWASALIEAHRGDYAVVGPVLLNANPRSMISWANLLLEYCPWLEGAGRAEVNDLPGHNSAYRKDLLLAYGVRLEELFEVELLIQRDLREKGHRMLFEPKARTNHLNFSRLSSALYLRFHAGRSFAGHRTMGWSLAKRTGYIVGSPMIPIVRFARIVQTVRASAPHSWLFPRALPMLALMLLLDGIGEIVGYVTGPGGAPDILGQIEFNRVRFMNKADREEFSAATLHLESRDSRNVGAMQPLAG